MDEKQWLTSTDPQAMTEFIRGKASDRELRLFAVACCRTVWELLPDDSTRKACRIAELAADGQADPTELRKVLQEIGPRVNDQYGVFLCGGCEGPGSTYAAMAATATLNPALTFTWNRRQKMTETLTAWECVARARAQTAKEEARSKRAREWDEVAPESEEEPDEAWYEETWDASYVARDKEYAAARVTHCVLLRDIVGNPFRPRNLDRSSLTPPVVALAQAIYDHQAFGDLPVLADALEEAGCEDAQLLAHLRSPGSHAKGCWAVDAVLQKS